MLVDVRSHEEYMDGHHDNAVNIPLDEIPTHDFNLPLDTRMILYCRSGARAEVAKEIMERRGFTHISLLNQTGAYY